MALAQRETDELRPAGPHVADSLETASLRSLVYIDRTGQVLPVRRARTRNALTWSLFGASWLAACGLFWMTLGPIGLAGAAIFTGLLGRLVANGSRLHRVFELVADERLDEAKRLAIQVAEDGRATGFARGQAHHLLAIITGSQGLHRTALEHISHAREHYPRHAEHELQLRLLAYTEINQLVELDRVKEARTKLDELGLAPASDYARLRHWTAELYVCFAEGRHPLDEEALHERARVGLSATPAVPLLALCGWAFRKLGDDDFADHLLRTAIERWESPVRNKFPRLDRWISALDLPPADEL